MTVRMNELNVDLTEVLEDCLKEYLIAPLPREKLIKTLDILISEIEKSTHANEKTICLSNAFYWDCTREHLVYKDEVIVLTKKERELLKLFLSDINRDFPYNMILLKLWGENSPVKQDSLKTLVKQLRKKLPFNIIKNIFAYGYRIDLSNNQESPEIKDIIE